MVPDTFGSALVGVTFVFYQVILVIYRLFFHPLSRFPGPKPAAASYWWEWVQDTFAARGGDYMNLVERMHDQYGPIVRVTPDEVHIRDPTWAHVLYSGPGQIRDKDSSLAHAAGTSGGTFGTVEHHVHRRRRTPIGSYFSRSSVAMMQDRIWDKTGDLCNVLREYHREKTVVNGRFIFLAWSNDTLRDCSFGRPLNLLGDTKLVLAFDQVIKAFAAIYPILKQCEWIIPLALRLPVAPFRYLFPPLGNLLDVHLDMLNFSKEACQVWTSKGNVRTEDGSSERAKVGQNTMFNAILASDLPADEKLPKRMAHEGLEILLAGTDTSARTMGVALYHVLANQHVLERLKEELGTVMPSAEDKVELKVLENLPWLTSIVKEALRIGKITDHRLSLVAPEDSLRYQQWLIPAGTRVSMTPARNSYDSRFFPDPTTFKPERWLQSEETVTAMNHVFMPFAHGTRGCLGMHFARAEMYIALAQMVRGFDFELFDTIRERDIDHVWSHIQGEPSRESKGLRFKVTRVY